ncbi:hypothetical protein K8T06_11805 [bacterium]|nr:hypothetical protein [bacterium]
MSKEQYIKRSVSNWLNSKGLHPLELREDHSPIKPDLVFKGSSEPLLVEVKVLNVYRSKVFPAIIGDVILRANHAVDPHIMLAILVKRLNSKAIEDLVGYAAAYRENLNWFLIDESGSGEACLYGQRSNFELDAYSDDVSGLRSLSSSGGNLFSTNNQWLLKMLLLPGIDRRYWGGSEKRPRSIMELSRLAGVPQPSVSLFAKRMEQAGYIDRSYGELIVIRHRELLDDWFYAQKNSLLHKRPVRSMYGDSTERLVKKIGEQYGTQQIPGVVVGHHMACHLHGLGRSSVKVAKLYAHPAVDLMNSFHLVDDASPSPAFLLVQKCAIYIEGGAVKLNGIPVCDILQCYLDVRESRARGQEQADYILEKVLLPHFARIS